MCSSFVLFVSFLFLCLFGGFLVCVLFCFGFFFGGGVFVCLFVCLLLCLFLGFVLVLVFFLLLLFVWGFFCSLEHRFGYYKMTQITATTDTTGWFWSFRKHLFWF